jgi:RpiR family carbohydrate utilization transcriptional regulator
MYENKPVLSNISAKMENMTKMQVKIANYVQKNPHQVIKLTISDLAAVTGSKSESAIVRFYKVLGFSGYHEFKVSLATEIAGKSYYHTYSDLTENDTIHDVKEKIFNGIIKTLHENYSLISDELLEAGADLLANAKRIFFIGYGQSGNLCANAAFKFMRLGYECYYNQDNHYNSIHLTEPREGDVLFCISFSGLSKDVVLPAKESKPVAKIIALTESKKSPLGKIADICFPTHTEELNYRTDIMMGRYVQSMIIDMLYMAVIIRKGEPARNLMSKSRQALSYLKF